MKESISLFALVLLPSVVFANSCMDKYLTSQLFNVLGIMFSLGLGLITTFDIGETKNKEVVLIMRKNLNKVRNKFVLFFALTIIFQFLDNKCPIIRFSFIALNCSVLYFAITLYSIFYYVVNFFSIQKLKDDITDKKLKEEDRP